MTAIHGHNLKWKESPGTLAFGTDGTITLANGNGRAFGICHTNLTFDNDATMGVDLARMINRIIVRSVHGELINMSGVGFYDMCALGGGIHITGGNLASNDGYPNYVTAATPNPLGEYHDFATEATADHVISVSMWLDLNSLPSSALACEIEWNAAAGFFQSTTFTTSPTCTTRAFQAFSPDAPKELYWYRSRVDADLDTTEEAQFVVPSARRGARVLWLAWSNRAAITADVTTVAPKLTGQVGAYRVEKASDIIASGRSSMAAAICAGLQDIDTQVNQSCGVPLPPEGLTDDDLTFFYTQTGLSNRVFTLSAMQMTPL